MYRSLLFFIETNLLFLAIASLPPNLINPVHLSFNSKYIFLTSFSFTSKYFIFSTCPLINQSSTLMLAVNITLELISNSSNDAKSPVSSCYQFYASLISAILKFLGTSSFSGIVISRSAVCFN